MLRSFLPVLHLSLLAGFVGVLLSHNYISPSPLLLSPFSSLHPLCLLSLSLSATAPERAQEASDSGSDDEEGGTISELQNIIPPPPPSLMPRNRTDFDFPVL